MSADRGRRLWDRGSCFRYGKATKTTATRSVAGAPHDRGLRLAAKRSLKRPAVKFNGVQARAIGRGFGEYAKRAGLSVLACAILPDHMHLVLAAHRLAPKQLVIQLKGAATQRLIDEGIHPFRKLPTEKGRAPKCFARGEWKVYIDAEDDVRAAIRLCSGFRGARSPIRRRGKPLAL
jgi:REP element-mobilizing transposase RayT